MKIVAEQYWKIFWINKLLYQSFSINCSIRETPIETYTFQWERPHFSCSALTPSSNYCLSPMFRQFTFVPSASTYSSKLYIALCVRDKILQKSQIIICFREESKLSCRCKIDRWCLQFFSRGKEASRTVVATAATHNARWGRRRRRKGSRPQGEPWSRHPPSDGSASAILFASPVRDWKFADATKQRLCCCQRLRRELEKLVMSLIDESLSVHELKH